MKVASRAGGMIVGSPAAGKVGANIIDDVFKREHNLKNLRGELTKIP